MKDLAEKDEVWNGSLAEQARPMHDTWRECLAHSTADGNDLGGRPSGRWIRTV
jgi:hypothetical protein